MYLLLGEVGLAGEVLEELVMFLLLVVGFRCQTIVVLRSWVGADMSEIWEFRYSVSGFLMLE